MNYSSYIVNYQYLITHPELHYLTVCFYWYFTAIYMTPVYSSSMTVRYFFGYQVDPLRLMPLYRDFYGPAFVVRIKRSGSGVWR